MVNVDIFSREDKHMVFDGFSVEGARAIFLKKKSGLCTLYFLLTYNHFPTCCILRFVSFLVFPLFLFFWPYISPEIAIKILETIMCSSILTLHDDFVALITVHPPSSLNFSSPLTCVALSFSWNDNLCWSDFSFFRLLNEFHFFRYLC